MKTVYAEHWGVCPDSGLDATAQLRRMLIANPDDTQFILSPGRYDFFAAGGEEKDYVLSNSDAINPHRLSIVLSGMKHIIFNGNGARFIFHGHTMPFTVDGSHSVTIKNLTIDWEIPLTAEGVVVRATPTYIDLAIDPALFPHRVEGDRLLFTGEDWEEAVWQWGNTEFDVRTGRVAENRGDTFPPTVQTLLPDGTVRFFGTFVHMPQEGNVVVLRHGKRIHAGIFLQDSTDVTVEAVTIHSTGGLGILAQFCTDLQFRRVSMLPNRSKGRRFVSGHDDGIHLTANSGTVLVEACSFLGLMDDPLNLHGIAAKIDKIVDAHTIQGRFMHEQSKGFTQWAAPGDTVSFVNARDMHTVAERRARSFSLSTPETFLLVLEGPIPLEVGEGDSLENLTCTAALICRNNHFGSCRARGILFCTPKPVLVENNIFESSGAAILIAGDASSWYESGSCRDVVIRGNYFASCCLSSSYLGGDAVISIHPEVGVPTARYPCHSNIRIEENLFQTEGVPLLYALSASGLTFCGNRLARSHTYPARCPGRAIITLSHCTDVTIQENLPVGDASWDGLRLCHTEETAVRCQVDIPLCTERSELINGS